MYGAGHRVSADRCAPRNRTFGIALAAVIVGMVGVSFASVPLYRLFCAVTGYGGTPQIGPAAAPGAMRQLITVRFNANTNPNLPWDFRPVQERNPPAARRRAARLLHRPQRGRHAGHRRRAVQRHAGHRRQVLPQDRLLLLQPADAGGRPADAVPAQLLGRSRDRQGSRHRGHPHDHAVLHLLPHARRCGEVRRARAGRSACRPAARARPLELHGQYS